MKSLVMTFTLIVGLTGLLAAQPSPAQLAFANGRVTVIVVDVPAAVVLAEWARLGQTEIAGAEGLGGRRVTLALSEVAESTAISAILGDGFGFVASLKVKATPSTSRLARIRVEPGRPVAAIPGASLSDPPEATYSYYVPEAAQVTPSLPDTYSPKVGADLPAPETVFEYFASENNDPNAPSVLRIPQAQYPKLITMPPIPETRFEYYVPAASRKPAPK